MKRHSPLPATPVYDGVAVAPLHLVYRSPDISYDKTPGRKQGIQCFRFLGSSALSIARLAAVIAASLLSDVPDFVPVSVSTDHFQRPRWIPWIIRYSTPRCSMFGLRQKGPSDPTSPHHASYWPISLLKAEAFSRSKSRSPVAA